MAKANAAVKIRLGSRPANFKKAIEFDMVEGGRGCFEVTYTYRTKTEYAEFYDAIQADLKAAGEAKAAEMSKAFEATGVVPDFTQTEAVKAQEQHNVAYIMGCVEGWNLEIPFDKEAVEQMVNEFPAAVTEIVSTYRAAIIEGRLGN